MEEDAITIVIAGNDDSFTVAVGEPLVGEFSATEIASDITEHAGGGGGGTDRLAAGGGATGALDTACRNVKNSLVQSDTIHPVGTQNDES